MKRKKSKILIVATLLTIALGSCDDREPWQRLLEQSEVELLDPYVLDSTVLRNTNEYNWVTYLEISDADEKRIIERIEKELVFMRVASSHEYHEKYRSESQEIYGYILNDEHHFGWHYNKYDEYEGTKRQIGFTSYNFELDTGTNKLIFSYWNE